MNPTQSFLALGLLCFGSLDGAFSQGVASTDQGRLRDGNETTREGRHAKPFWKLDGNAGTTAGANFLGTTDNQPLELKVNGLRALRLEGNTNCAPNLIGGASVNDAAPGVVGATIGGGGVCDYAPAWLLFGQNLHNLSNRVAADFGVIAGGLENSIHAGAWLSSIGGGWGNTLGSPGSTVAGGKANTIGTNSPFSAIGGGVQNRILADQARFQTYAATISGGYFNTTIAAYAPTIGGGEGNLIEARCDGATIAGGLGNRIRTEAFNSTIGGGLSNTIETDAFLATIGGGFVNTVQSRARYSTIGGGELNTNNGAYSVISGGSQNTTYGAFSTVPGGKDNFAGGEFSLAAGRRAKAYGIGTFVWADSTDADVSSTANNQFVARASGGVVFYSNPDLTSGVVLPPGGGSWAILSDRNAKENLEPVDGRAVLDKLCAVPLATWNYKTQDKSIRHIGPMAQDFAAAFRVGEDAKHITGVDADGVALAAIQGLNEIVQEKDARIAALEKSVAELKEIVGQLRPQEAPP